MSEVGKCKECGAEITRSTTFCRSCNSVFPEFVEISEDTSASDEDKKTEKKNPYGDSGLSYHSIGSSQEKETEKPQASPPSESEPDAKPFSEPTDDRKPEPFPPVELAQENENKPESEVELEPQPEPPETTRPVEKKDRPVKSASGEFAVFQSPKLPPSSSGLRLIESGKNFFSSAEVIAELASETSRSTEEVAGVIDGFWDYVADLRQHYKEGVKSHLLPIPHFGIFRFRFIWKKGGFRPKLTFKSSTTVSAKAHLRTYSSKWADQWSGDVENLSVRRKISVYISERCGLPLLQSDMIFNRLLRTVRELCEGGGRIHWARRGTMGTFRVTDKKERSGINAQTREKISVRTGRDSITGERIPEEGNEHFSFAASKGFLNRLNLPDPPKEPGSGGFKTPRRKLTHGEKAGCNGCLGIFALTVLLLLGWIASMAVDAYEEASSEPENPTTELGTILEAIPAESLDPLQLKSNASNFETVVLFSNQLDYPVVVYWVDFNGKREKFMGLWPGRKRRLSTYAGHLWLITDRQGKALFYFIAGGAIKGYHGLAEITPRNVPSK